MSITLHLQPLPNAKQQDLEQLKIATIPGKFQNNN